MARPAYNRMHRVRTGDNWPVTLYEYDPHGTGPKPVPVILCHGSFCRYNFYDQGGGRGLAPWLASRGYRVFSADLRGRGRSVPGRDEPRPLNYRRWHWRIHDIIEFDLPAIAGYVTGHTGAPSADYLGHSMGGIVGFSHLFRTGDRRIRKFIAAGTLSPFTGHRLMNELDKGGDTGAFDLMQLMGPVGKIMPFIPLQPAASLMARAVPGRYLHRQPAFNYANMDDRDMRNYLRRGAVNVSAAKMKSFRELFGGAEGAALAAMAAGYSHPTLWIAGSRDLLVPPKWSELDYENLRTPSKRFVRFGKRDGYSANYGHGDLFLGRQADREVFPVIESWLMGTV